VPEDDSLIFADDEVFQRIHQSFATFGYSENNIRGQYIFDGFPSDAFVWPNFSQRKIARISGLDMLVYLFMGQESILVDEAVRLLGSRFLSEMQKLNLIQIDKEGGTCIATVRIEPVQDLLICADRLPDKVPVRQDIVYRPWDLSAQTYSRIIPETNCKNLLEMCCGAGHAYLTAAKNYAQFACGVDINPRAVQFAEFNQKLN